MIFVSSIVALISGTPQFRIKEDLSDAAPTYFFYGQSEIEEDLIGSSAELGNRRQIKTFDSVGTTATGDVIFSLISGKATIVQASHSGYLLTQNYVKMTPSSSIDAQYLVYLVNEDAAIRHQLQSSQQGSVTLKYTIKQLNTLMISPLPSIEKQKAIGDLYFSQLKLAALKRRVSELETTLVLGRIKEANQL